MASSPKVPLIRPHRGSVARSAMGCRARLMPTARYSCRAMSPKFRTSNVSLVAASPSDVGHWENAGVNKAAPGLSSVPCLGSVAMVMGMPRRVRSAIFCMVLLYCAIRSASSEARILKLFIFLRAIISEFVGSIREAPRTMMSVDRTGVSIGSPFGVVPIILTNKVPAFSSRFICESRSFTRASRGASASS